MKTAPLRFPVLITPAGLVRDEQTKSGSAPLWPARMHAKLTPEARRRRLIRLLQIPLLGLGACVAEPDPGLGGGYASSGEGGTGSEEADAGHSEADTGTELFPDLPSDTAAGHDEGESSDPSCVELRQAKELSSVPPALFFLLDRSGSMSSSWDHDASPATPEISRWASVHAALASIASFFAGEFEAGAAIFPSQSAELDEAYEFACLFDPTPALPLSPLDPWTIQDGLPSADALCAGGTPARAAIELGASVLGQLPDEQPRAMVLLTDGAANCVPGSSGEDSVVGYDSGLAPRLAQLVAEGLSTYVVGIDIVDKMGTMPAANPYAELQEVALAGGVPRPGAEKFYAVEEEAELLAALGQIGSDIACTLPAPAPILPSGEDGNLLEVWGDGALLQAVGDCDLQAGYRYLPGGQLTICGEACTAGLELELVWGCEP